MLLRHASRSRFPRLFSHLSVPLALAALLFGGLLAGCDASGEEEGGQTFIEGTVVDATTGDSLAGALVTVTPPGEILAESGPDGFFSARVELDSTTELSVMVEKDGYAATTRSLRAEPGGVEQRMVTLTPADGGAGVPTVITGVVSSVDDGTVENARVETQAEGETYSTRVSEDGSYRLEPRITGDTELTVRAISDESTAQRTVTVFPDGMRSGVDFTLGSGTFTVSGQVLDGDDDPVAGVRVEVPANAQTAGDQTFATQTGDDGSYTLDVDLTASTNLTVRAVSGETNVEKIITAFPDQSQSGVDLVLGASTATVSGSVTDGDADAVDDARVETTVGGETFSTQTEASGDYTLNVQIAGSMELTVRAVSDDRQAEQTVTVAPGETDEGINFVLGSSTGGGTATVTGQVTDSQENPVVDARIEVENTDQTIGDQPFTTLTGDDGQYSLDVELRSSAEVTVQAVRDDLGATKTVTLVPGQTRSDIDFVLGGSTEDSGVATVSGRVTSDGDPVSGARIAALPNEQTVSDQPVTTRTESDGTYTLDVEITASTDLTVRASSDGREAEQVVTVFPGDTRSDVDFSFATGGGGDDDGDDGNDGPSGTPSNILLLDVSRTVIGIQGSGSPETARVTYQVADSSGQAVSLDNETPVRFELSGASPDGAFVAPAEATTNDQGEVTVNVSSGLRSGTIQIVATAETSDGTIIESRPITITIHGGLPDQEHFSISPARANFQGLATNGITNPVEVIVGDQYSNPVKPGTAVYFESTHGIIEGSATTDDQGRGTVQLISGNPKPENGVSVVTASTQNRDGNRIEVKTPVLFTSRGILKVVSIPTETFSEPLDLRQREDVETLKEALGSDFPFGGYEFVVEDRNGNPLPQGTTVGFDAGGTEVGASGDTDVTLSDTDVIDDEGDGFDYDDVVRGFGITRFSAAAVRANDPETVEPPDLETVTFRFAGPQGQRAYTFSEPAEGEAASVVVYKDGEPVARF